DRLDNELVALETAPDDRDTLASIFRTIHTIKGTCGFLGFGRLEKVAHAGENLLSKLRDGEIRLTPERTTALLAMVDAVRAMLGAIEREGGDGREDYAGLIERLKTLQREAPAAAPAAAAVPSLGEILVQQGVVPPARVEQALARQDAGDPRLVGEILVHEGAVPPAALVDALKAQKDVAREAKAPVAAETSIRVDVGLLDQLMNLVGELVLTRNQVLQYAKTVDDSRLATTSQRLNLITTELQEGVMKTRMQPINNIWNKVPRVVRDLALGVGKQIRVDMVGKETELDKSLIEAMKDPLTHLVRNCVDHGIETPVARSARGKPAEGVLTLRAYHEGGQVIVEISDDGAGIDPHKLKAKALAKGLIGAEQAEAMSERELTNLIFLPGFSTAEQVTNISGRGVGMDVVKTNIEKISGNIELHSEPGRGTLFKIHLPLTLAIVPALIVTSGEQRFAIPQGSLQELIRLDDGQRIEDIHGAPVYRLRGKLLPLVYLARELGLEPAAARGGNIVVLAADKRRFGLVVDAINDTQEIVVKPLSTLLKGLTVFAGATVMGDGRVVLILDILGLAQRARIVAETRDAHALAVAVSAGDAAGEHCNLLLVRSPGDGRLAIPLSQVARLEEFPRASLEYAGHQQVVQYRRQILPLIQLDEVLPERRTPDRLAAVPALPEAPVVQVVVYTVNGRSLGLVVEQIIDIVEASLSLSGEGSREGVLGTTVLQGRVTELFDVQRFLERTFAALFPHAAAAQRVTG
ncbi:two-component system chemotaxis sensor kinase CheA, partial [Plasticicumulans lactativorans]